MLLSLGPLPLLLPLLLSGGSAAVPRPENVSVSCQNFHTVVYWNYSRQHPQTTFRLTIGNTNEQVERETKELQYDLTDFIWQSSQNFKANNYVQIRAVQGGQESPAVDSPIFSFNSLMTAAVTCKLDFPPVDLSVKGSQGEATVSFQNPRLFYRELRGLPQLQPLFGFTLSSDSDYQWSCEDEEICRYDFAFDESQENCCVQLSGEMFDNSRSNTFLFTTTQQICASSSDSHLVALVISLLVFVTVVVVLTLVICKVRAWVMSPPPTPKCLDSLLTNPEEEGTQSLHPSESGAGAAAEPVVAKITVVSEKADEDSCETDSSCVGSDVSPPTPAGSMYLYGGLSDEDEEEEEEERAGYDRPHLPVDMGGGDMVQGYDAR
ncbi:interferon gamma receptor 1 [Myripristis murdjan]|uniref:Interferon gamma receptor 1-like n=1 Tax=Myripristis murdjan TaxID=586833 RepID=A0A667ZGY9_9TELE|nr:interferon gamma receptor 1-like [Myripristis murdjan]